ncbi:MAG: hypothetical protein LBJ59_09070 [Zoogloeaceae bacterium]|jgi:hypothetical protein|nr:hypothetical protein [Zoogloeaceae bacterium]
MSIFKNVLIGLDQTLNCLIRMDGEYGAPDETLSARVWRKREHYPKTRRFIDLLFFFDRVGDTRHCELSYTNEMLRRHLPKEYRESLQ